MIPQSRSLMEGIYKTKKGIRKMNNKTCASLIASAIIVLLAGCSGDNEENSVATRAASSDVGRMSAREQVLQHLAGMGIEEGVSLDYGIVTIGSAAGGIEQFKKWGMSFAEMMNVLFREAYLGALENIAKTLECKVKKAEKVKRNMTPDGEAIRLKACANISQLEIFNVSWICNGFGKSEVAFAVKMPVKPKAEMEHKRKMSLHDWIDRQRPYCFIGAQLFTDEDGKTWAIGSYLKEVDDKSISDKICRDRSLDMAHLAGPIRVQVVQEVTRNVDVTKNEVRTEKVFEDCYYGVDGCKGNGKCACCIETESYYKDRKAEIQLEREFIIPTTGKRARVFISAFSIDPSENFDGE